MQPFASPLAYIAERDHGPQFGATKQAAIGRLIEVSRTLGYARQMGQTAAQHVAREIGLPDSEEAKAAYRVLAEEADAVFVEHLSTFAGALTSIYDKHFTLDEITAMSDFYVSATGQKLLDVMPLVMGEVAALTEHWARSLTPVFYRKALARTRPEAVEG